MSETPVSTPSPPRTLQRSATDRTVLGVCGGFAEYYGLDPLVVRIAVAVLALFGGLGIVLYLAGAAWLPEPGDTSPITSSRRLPMLVIAIIAALVILPGAVFPFGDGAGFLVAAAVVVLIVLLAQRQRPAPPPPVIPPEHIQPVPQPTEAPEMSDTSAAPFPESGGYASTPYPQMTYAPPPPTYPPAPKAPRARSYLGAVTLCVALIWFGTAWALNAADATSMSAVTIFGVSLAILGAGILIGAWIGRARWLVLLALPLSLMVWGLAAVPEGVRLGEAGDWVAAGIGETDFQPVSATDDAFEWGFGSASLVVSDWEAYADDGLSDITASVGIGELVISVPDDWNVVVNAEVGLGSIRSEGVQLADGPGLEEVLTFESATAGAPRMSIDATVDLGEIRIITTDSVTS